jgi:uncharacterized protein (DUF983 family)
MPSFARVSAVKQNPVRMFGRALLLRCPRCGGRGLFVSWFTLQERCAQCALPLQRGEAHDYWIGGMMFNIVLSEFLAVAVVGGAILLTWPDVPWMVVRIGAIVLMLAAPFLLYPMSRLMWLAFDLVFRPGHESHYR